MALPTSSPSSESFSNKPLDRTTQIGELINSYLQKKREMDDQAAHLLFSANRWEKQSVQKYTYIHIF